MQVLITFSPRGVPDGHRHMHGYGSHTFKWVNKEGKAHWVKFHFLSDQGIKNLTHEQAVEIAGINPDYSTEDLFDNIENGNGPSWTFKVQVSIKPSSRRGSDKTLSRGMLPVTDSNFVVKLAR